MAMRRLVALVCIIICNFSVIGIEFSRGAAAAPTAAFVGQITTLSSADNYSLVYVATIQLGTPAQLVTLALDTSLELTTVSTQSFSPAKSSTYAKHQQLGYTGVLSSDTVTLNSTDGFNPVDTVPVKGIQFLLSNFYKLDLLALGSGPNAFPAQISSAAGIAKKFAYCLGSQISVAASPKYPTPIFFGNTSYYFDSGLAQFPQTNGVPYPEYDITPYLKYVPLIKTQNGGYAIHITSIGVNEDIGNGSLVQVDDDAAVGTEAPYTRLAEPFYTQIRQAFLNTPVVKDSFQRLPGFSHGPLDLCFNFSGPSIGIIRASPVITFNFKSNSQQLSVTYDNYLVDVDDANNIYCFGFVSAGPVKGSSVIGTFQQIDNLVEFDLEKERVGFTGSLIPLRSNCGNFNFTKAN